MTNRSDEQLWGRSIDDDHSAFATIFQRHVGVVHKHCFRRVASWSTAEDLTSVVFLEAWRKRESVVFVDETLRPWLLGVAVNVCRNWARSLKRHSAALERMTSAATIDDTHGDGREEDLITRRLDAEKQMAVVLAELRKLTDSDREIIELSAWDELGYSEIAVVLDIPVGTVRSRLSRARTRLRTLTDLHIDLEEVQ